jgi:hypothetical protein
MFDRRHPLGWLFYLLIAVSASPGQTPTTTTISEGLFGGRSGAEKKDAAMSFISAALQLSDAVTARHIVDEVKFKQGLSGVIDGVVLCLNASTWSKPAQP